MSNEKIITEVEKSLETLNKGLSKMKQALSSANQAVLQAEAYNKGLEDIWKLLDKTESMSDDEYYDCFGESVYDGITKLTPQEALEKLKAYEKVNEIKVGDVVKCSDDDIKAVVMDNGSQEFLWQVFTENGCIELWKECEFVKTGKHIDLTDLFKQIGGAE